MKQSEKEPRQQHAKPSAREQIAINMVRLRRALGISQEELAFRAGLHRTFIAHVERLSRNVAIDNVERIATALGVDTWRLLHPPTKGEGGLIAPTDEPRHPSDDKARSPSRVN